MIAHIEAWQVLAGPRYAPTVLALVSEHEHARHLGVHYSTLQFRDAIRANVNAEAKKERPDFLAIGRMQTLLNVLESSYPVGVQHVRWDADHKVWKGVA